VEDAMQSFKYDNREFKKYLKKLSKADAKKSVKAYVNSMAFNTRKEAVTYTMRGVFKFKNSSTKRYITKNVSYKKAGADLTSEIGAKGNPKGSSFGEVKSGFLATQETGGTAQQLKSKGKGKRDTLFQKNPTAIPGKKVVRVPTVGIIKIKPTGNTKRKFAKAVSVARKKNIKFISNVWGVYKVTKTTLKKIYSITNKPHKIQKRQWLKPATERTVTLRNDIWKEAIQHLEKSLKK